VLEKLFALPCPSCRGFSPVLLGHGGQALDLFHVQSQPLGDPTTVVPICLEENSRLAQLYALLGIANVTYDISNSSRNVAVRRRRYAVAEPVVR